MLWIKLNNKDYALYELSRNEATTLQETINNNHNETFDCYEWEDFTLFDLSGSEDILKLWEFDCWFYELDDEIQHKIAYYVKENNVKFNKDYEDKLLNEIQKFYLFDEDSDNKDWYEAMAYLFKHYEISEKAERLITVDKLFEVSKEDKVIEDCNYYRYDYVLKKK